MNLEQLRTKLAKQEQTLQDTEHTKRTYTDWLETLDKKDKTYNDVRAIISSYTAKIGRQQQAIRLTKLELEHLEPSLPGFEATKTATKNK